MERVESYYDQHSLREWERLERHRTEFAVTMCALREHLPAAPARILDVGGGPGRYSLALALSGYSVTLLDLSAGNLALAREKAREQAVRLEGFVHGSALDLTGFPASSFDAVLLMGPLYHLLQSEQRAEAVRQALRALRPGGLLFTAFITRYAPIRDMAKYEPEQLHARREWYEALLATGIYRAPANTDGSAFTDAYFALPSEVRPFMEGLGLHTLDLIACEGITSMLEEKVNELNHEAWSAWAELNYRLGKDPSIHGSAEHLLHVGVKPGARV